MDMSALPSDGPPSDTDQSCAEKQPETGKAPAGNPNGVVIPSSDGEPMLLPLEVDILEPYLPEALDVFIGDQWVIRAACRSGKASDAEQHNFQKFLAHCPVKFVREYPRRPITTTPNCEEVIIDGPKATATMMGFRAVGQLDLRKPKFLDCSNHSYVFLAPLTLPSSAAAAPLHGGVVVKTAKELSKDREMLVNEAGIYDEFPGMLQECNPSSPPIVPKFYGYYVPSLESIDHYKVDNEDEEAGTAVRKDARRFLRCLSPILLLEFCGEPIRSKKNLSTSDWDTIGGMYERLHDARFVQKSLFQRNILVQPGPLTHPRAERSLENPSYRLIDFGRGKCYIEDESVSADDDLKDERQQVPQIKFEYSSYY